MEKIVLLLGMTSCLDKEPCFGSSFSILAHSYRRHGEEWGEKDRFLMQPYTQQQQGKNLSGDDRERASLNTRHR